jgi:hypothetical protein
MRIVTIACRSEIALVRVLAESIAAHAGTLLTALVLDATAEDRGSPESFTLLDPEAAGIVEIGLPASVRTAPVQRDTCKRACSRMPSRASPARRSSISTRTRSAALRSMISTREHDVLVRRRTVHALPHDGRRPNEADPCAWGLNDSGLFVLGPVGDHGALLD